MGPGVGAQRRGPVPEGCLMESIMTALAPLKSRHPRLGLCACVCVCDAQVFQSMLKLRSSTFLPSTPSAKP